MTSRADCGRQTVEVLQRLKDKNDPENTEARDGSVASPTHQQHRVPLYGDDPETETQAGFSSQVGPLQKPRYVTVVQTQSNIPPETLALKGLPMICWGPPYLIETR